MGSVTGTRKPAVSVVIVGDYACGTDIAVHELRETLRGLAAQDFDEPVEYVLCESDTLADQLPDQITALLPGLRLLRSPATTSCALKNDGARSCAGELIAILDADVVPARDWLRRCVAAMRRQPDVAVVSGRTLHRDTTLAARAFALIERGHLDPGKPAPTRYLANHAAVYRRSTLLAHPFHPTAGPFGSRLQSEAILRSGEQLFFEPSAHVFHTYGGWLVQADIARNNGYGTVVTRAIDREQPFASLLRLGPVSIPFFIAGKTLSSLADCVRCYRHYGIRVYELPQLFTLAILARLLEAPGMWRALRGRNLAASAYR